MTRLTIAGLVAKVDELNGQLTSERAHNAELRAALDVKTGAIEGTNETVAFVRNELADKISQCNALSEQVTKLTKELEAAKSSAKYYDGRADKANDELGQAHAMLDGLPGAGPRKLQSPDDQYTTTALSVTTRLTTYLASLVRNPNKQPGTL